MSPSSLLKPPPSFHLPFIYANPLMLILILVHIFSGNSTAAPIPLPLTPRSLSNSCDDINQCRKLSDIVWGCLATIFACTWVSVHPNVRGPNQSWLALFWRRIKMMLIGIIAPELMVGFAARQFLGARMLAKRCPVAILKQLEDPLLGAKFREAIRNVNAEDIKDKSKCDALSKGVALAQGLWFTTQCLARLHQRITITELEIATLAFAVINIFIWLLWWDKPLDVQRQIVIPIGPAGPQHAQLILPVPILRGDRLTIAILGADDDDYDPLSSTSVPSFWSVPVHHLRGVTVGIAALAGSVFGAIHCTAWTSEFPTSTEMRLWRSCSLVISAFGIFLLALFLSPSIDNTAFHETMLGNALNTITAAVVIVGPPIYIPARLILIVLPLAALRSLPPSAFVDVNWSAYIPHI